MITITLSFFAFLEEQFGRKQSISIDEPIKIIELFQYFSTKNGEDSTSIFLSGNQLNNGFTILLNGRNIQALDELNTILEEECEVSFFPVIAGGLNQS